MTMRKGGSRLRRIQPASSAEATTPSIPARWARDARRPTSSRMETISRPQTSSTSAAVSDVRTVTPRSLTRSPAASRAASIIEAPPAVWRVRSSTSSAAAAATAPATVLGMSWSFKSRKTRFPRRRSSSTTRGPERVNSSRPTL